MLLIQEISRWLLQIQWPTEPTLLKATVISVYCKKSKTPQGGVM